MKIARTTFIQRNSSDLKALNRRLAVAISKRFLSTRADTLPRPPIVLTEKEEEEEESIGCRGSEEKRGKGRRDQQGETKEWRTAVDELCRVPSLLHSFSSSPLLSPRPVPFHPLNPTQKASLSAATPASFRRLITYARERPAQAYESSSGDGPNPLSKPRLAKTINKRPACSRDKRDLS